MLNKLLPLIVSTLLTISITLSGWTIKETVELRARVAALEVVRVTPADTLAVWKEISVIKEKVAALPNNQPPQWFVDYVKQMEQRIDSRMEKVEAKLDRLTLK